MDCTKRFGVVVVLGSSLLVGCSKSGSTDGTTTTVTGIEVKESDPNSSPMAKAAYEFLDAVLKGDTQRAGAKLTPAAMQRIVASGKQFAPPGLESASFKIGEVRSPAQDFAVVQCVLTDISEGAPHNEEMCCLLKQVENEWRVSGIAYGTAPDKPWTLSDFETGQNRFIPWGGMGGQMAGGQQGPTTQQGAGMQQTATAPPVAPPAPLGQQQYGPANVNAPNAGTAGLGMPAVGPANYGQQQAAPQSYPPYTAQEPQGTVPR